MARTIAALMRHGHYHQPEHTPSAHLPYPLTETGREQATSVAREVLEVAEEQGWAVDPVIETSHLLRAWETGRIIRERWVEMLARGFTVESFEDLSERSVGSAANLTEEQITAIVEADPRHELPPNWRLDSVLRLPFSGAESLMEAGERVLRHLDHRFRDLAEVATVDTVRLVVGHGGSIRHAAIHMGILRLEEVLGLSMRNCGVVYFERFPDGSWKHVLGEWKVRDRKPAESWAPRD
ncbi:MAG: histidine phosphatase family protein [Candidatus Eisenbacteria bacterium]|nr:histidine phosphatase family protein [Candidatus Eisenbacteria bacterium]